MTRQEYIEALLPGVRQSIVHFVGPENERRSRAKLDGYTTNELSIMYAKQKAAEAPPVPTVTKADIDREKLRLQEELDELKIRLQAETAADVTMGAYARWEEKEPERQAQLARDRQTFIDASNTLRSFAVNEANFSVIRSTLGEAFTVYAISQGILSNALILVPPTEQQINEWTEQDEQARKQRLLNATPTDLRQIVRAESEQRRVQAAQNAAAEVQRAHEERDKARGYPPLPTVAPNGKPLDAIFIKRADRQELRFLIQRYGESAVTARLRGQG